VRNAITAKSSPDVTTEILGDLLNHAKLFRLSGATEPRDTMSNATQNVDAEQPVFTKFLLEQGYQSRIE
jgi:hypothetical protein